MVLCFVGVIIIVCGKPLNSSNTELDEAEGGFGTRLIGIGIAFTMSWTYAATSVLNRALKEINFSIVLFYHAIIGTSLAIAYILLEHWISGNPFRVYTA